jgi:hypothetical protein
MTGATGGATIRRSSSSPTHAPAVTVRQSAGHGYARAQRAQTVIPGPVVESGENTGGGAAFSTSSRMDDADDLIAVLEERILAQLERRGGRFQGVW